MGMVGKQDPVPGPTEPLAPPRPLGLPGPSLPQDPMDPWDSQDH